MCHLYNTVKSLSVHNGNTNAIRTSIKILIPLSSTIKFQVSIHHIHTQSLVHGVTLYRWCPITQRSIHLHLIHTIPQPKFLHWDLAERRRFASNWLTFTRKSCTCAHNPATDGVEFVFREGRKDMTIDSFRSVEFVYRHKKKSVGCDK